MVLSDYSAVSQVSDIQFLHLTQPQMLLIRLLFVEQEFVEE